jgi:hypothetical protein
MLALQQPAVLAKALLRGLVASAAWCASAGGTAAVSRERVEAWLNGGWIEVITALLCTRCTAYGPPGIRLGGDIFKLV